jgi:hypothetical protein
MFYISPLRSSPSLFLSSSPSLSLSPLFWFGGDGSRRPTPAPGLSHGAAANQGARPRRFIQWEHATSPRWDPDASGSREPLSAMRVHTSQNGAGASPRIGAVVHEHSASQPAS